MNVHAVTRSGNLPTSAPAVRSPAAAELRSLTPPAHPAPPSAEDQELRETFDSVIGQTLFGQMLRSMRKTVHKPAYFHGGRAEEVFQQQLDQVLAEKISQASAARFTEPMYELFTLGRK
jgi:Rod binding domain-containing protein